MRKLSGQQKSTHDHERRQSLKGKEFAEDWYLQLRGKLRDGELKSGKMFREAAKLYLREFDITHATDDGPEGQEAVPHP